MGGGVVISKYLVVSTQYSVKSIQYFGPRYRLGALYAGYGGYQVGLNAERIRHGIQNRWHMAHWGENNLVFK
jgi:hypothetical protein